MSYLILDMFFTHSYKDMPNLIIVGSYSLFETIMIIHVWGII